MATASRPRVNLSRLTKRQRIVFIGAGAVLEAATERDLDTEALKSTIRVYLEDPCEGNEVELLAECFRWDDIDHGDT